MNTVVDKLSPRATKMIRMDHTHVMSNFHKYEADASPEKKRAIVNVICLGLEIHAQLEEEIFYPALAEVTTDDEVLARAKPEHDEMRRLIDELRSMEPTDEDYDSKVYELMRDVIHHVADEETMLLPAAELLLKDRLAELGAQMTRRRMELAGPRAGEIALNQARAMPAATMLMAAGGLLAGGYLLKQALGTRHH
jgi:hemerythrin superfamily protein|nr:hemerythrin domain-containing protein [uncultured Caldimonas sp.]